MKRTILFLAALLSGPAHADIEVAFQEGAPKDRFTIRNLAACPLSGATVTIDLAGSKGELIFDTTATGAGVEVFQPFEIVQGEGSLSGAPEVSDGDRLVALSVSSLAPKGEIAFTIDVDDTVASRGITVAGSELAGATVRVAAEGKQEAAAFAEQPIVRVRTPVCP